jgi:hypothetical protein
MCLKAQGPRLSEKTLLRSRPMRQLSTSHRIWTAYRAGTPTVMPRDAPDIAARLSTRRHLGTHEVSQTRCDDERLAYRPQEEVEVVL